MIIQIFRRFFIGCLFIVMTGFLCASRSGADVIDRVVAIVNDDVITLSEVNEEGKPLMQRVAETVPAAEMAEAMQRVRQTVVERLIEEKIMLQEAEKVEISVSEEELEMAYKKILEQNNTDIDHFRQQLAGMGMTEAAFKDNLRNRVLSSKLLSLEIRSKIIINEEQIIDYYDKHYTKRVGEDGYYILQIGIAGEGTGQDGETAEKKAERIRSLAVAGEDFRELARKYSDLPSAADGGDIGVLNKDDMPGKMLEAISRTEPGGISEILKTSAGFQFFKLLSSQNGQIVTKVPYESVKDEIHEILYQQKTEAQFEDWLKNKKSQAYIKIL